MNIHSICIVKDEVDIVGDVLKDASKWSDYIYIFDNGSTDGTTKILKDLAEGNDEIIYYKWSDEVFHDALRSEVFHAFKQNAQKGDWWCRLDADEFYIDDPRKFLSKVNDSFNAVSNSSFNYFITKKDLQKYHQNPASFTYKNLRYYKNCWSEIRFVKDNGHLYWPPSSSWPVINMKVYPQKIRVMHYQYRNPEQVKKSIKNRNLALARFTRFNNRYHGTLKGSAILDPEIGLVSHKVLNYDSGDENLKTTHPIPEWKPKNNMSTKIKNSLKNLLYRLNLLNLFYNLLGKKQ